MKRFMIGAILAVALALAGCSHHNAASSPSTITPAQLAQRLAANGLCTDYAVDTSPQLGTREQGDCTINGESAWIATTPQGVSGADWMKQWQQALQLAGGVYIVGDRWVISVQTQDTANRVQQVLGGTIQ